MMLGKETETYGQYAETLIRTDGDMYSCRRRRKNVHVNIDWPAAKCNIHSSLLRDDRRLDVALGQLKEHSKRKGKHIYNASVGFVLWIQVHNLPR